MSTSLDTGADRGRNTFRYSPERRTALVLSGTGAHGAYHAGVLRAIEEAGVKIDVVAGHGVGAAAAVLAAIDGSARLWDRDGLWQSDSLRRLYGWKRSLRAAGWLALVLLLTLLTPLAFLAVGLVVYPAGFVLAVLGTDAGAALMDGYAAWIQTAFAGETLSTAVPRVAMLALGALVAVLAAGALTRARRRGERGWWWRIAGAPLDAYSAQVSFIAAVTRLIGGGTEPVPSGPGAAPQPGATAPAARAVSRTWRRWAGSAPATQMRALGRRYSEVLSENLGQPRFRELMIVVADLDARGDVVAALLREPYRGEFGAPREGRERGGEAIDLSGTGGDLAVAVASAALTPPVLCEPSLLTFALDSYWRGETHRCCDRPGTVSRLLEELAAAGVSQAVVVCAVPSSAGPHRLTAPRLDPRGRLGEFLAASEAAALRDALEMARLRFDSVYLISPAHNPLGAFDFTGAYDAASDRRQELGELMSCGYEDAYRQFIDPVVGASGEHLMRAATSAARLPREAEQGPS